MSEDLPALVNTFLSELDGFRPESRPTPPAWHEEMSRAVALKRTEDYLGSATIYVSLTRESGAAHSPLVRSLFKTVACAGYLAEALNLAAAGKAIYDLSPNRVAASYGDQSAFEADIAEMLISSKSPARLSSYLSRISGNPIYRVPRDYLAMVEELEGAAHQLAEDLGPQLLTDMQTQWEHSEREDPGLTVVPTDSDIRATLGLANEEEQQGNLSQAIELYTKALGDGIFNRDLKAVSMFNLGLLLERRGDIHLAIRWFTKAAQLGEVLAMYRLGILLVESRQFDDAIYWHREGLDVGYPNADLRVAGMYSLGRALHLRGDLDQAVHWYKQLLDSELPSELRIDTMGKLGTALQVLGDIDQAILWFTKGAEAGDHRMMVSLGAALQDQGKLNDAVRWLTTAAGAGNDRAMFLLGFALRERGMGLMESEDMRQSGIWIRKAADAGNQDAKEYVAQLAPASSGSTYSRQAAARVTNPQAKSGCYIATAVYGSQDAAPVVTLRRWRDESLATSLFGRMFIRCYYAVSPSLAKHFEHASRLNAITRRILDLIVSTLEKRV